MPRRKILLGAGAAYVLRPPLQFLEGAANVMQDRLVVREVVKLDPVGTAISAQT